MATVRMSRRSLLTTAAISATLSPIFLNTHFTFEKDSGGFFRSEIHERVVVPSSCTICGQGCPLKIEVLDGKIISKILHNTHPRYSKYYAACGKPRILAEVWNHPDRIKQPMIRAGPRGSGVFRAVSWDEALDYVAENLRKYLNHPEQIVFFSHQGSEASIFDEFGRALGTPNITDHADTCFHGSAAGRWFLFGRLVGPGAVFPDYENAQFIVFMGRNPYGGIVAAPWAKIMSVGMEAQKRIVVFDIRHSDVCEIAERYYIIRPGTDLAISLAIMNEILINKLYNVEYLNKYTNASMLFYIESKEPVELYTLESGPRAGKKDYLVYDDEEKIFVAKSKSKRPKLDFVGLYQGQRVATTLKLLEDSIKQYTVEWAEKISGVGAEEIRWVAQMLAQYSPRSFIDPGYKSVRYFNEPMMHRVNALINVLIGAWGSRGGVAWARRAAVPAPRPDGELKYEAVAKC